ncbi:MAG: hypothetical protein R6V44_00230 [Paracoccaceae bacterium]
MIEFISQNSEALQVFINSIMVVVWVAYLQIFLVSFRRQQRSEILINIGGGSGLKARCFVSNLSLEPLYLHDVMVELTTNDATHEAVITDRSEMNQEKLTSPSGGTNQGPLKSGDYVDIGSFNEIMERASPKLESVEFDKITHIQITAFAKASSSPQIVGAKRKYRLQKSNGQAEMIPLQITTEQIRSWWGRWKLRRRMNQGLEAR